MILAPSVLAADLGQLAAQVQAAERGGAGLVHVDVMDGRFVPNISLGPAVVAALRRASALPIDAHLMVESAELYLDAFVDAGAASVSVHVEAVRHLERAVAHLRGRGARAGVALNPSTPIATLEEILPELDYVLLMSVNPGFAGQTFLPPVLDKIRRLRRLLDERGLAARIQVDGGVHLGNIRTVVQAGAEIVVAGAAAFAKGDPEAACRALLEAAA
ncbi:MAG: ribulose-phosphate 3-epimerase [Betaproteobacteria bacterium]